MFVEHFSGWASLTGGPEARTRRRMQSRGWLRVLLDKLAGKSASPLTDVMSDVLYTLNSHSLCLLTFALCLSTASLRVSIVFVTPFTPGTVPPNIYPQPHDEV